MASVYRITVKSWDRHYGEGHVEYSDKFEARESKAATEKALASLERGIALVKPQGREALAWAELSDRHGPKTLRKYRGETGKWVLG